jgi:hypothetical protein
MVGAPPLFLTYDPLCFCYTAKAVSYKESGPELTDAN